MAFSSPEVQTPQKGQWLQDGRDRPGTRAPGSSGVHRGGRVLVRGPRGGTVPGWGVGGVRAAQSGTPYQVGSRGHGPGCVQA